MRTRITVSLESVAAFFIIVYLTWYATPLLRGVFEGATYNYLFMGIGLLGALILFVYKPLSVNELKKSMILPITLYLVTLVTFVVLGIGNANEYIRINAAFCITVFLEQALQRTKNFEKYMRVVLILFGITFATTMIALFTDPGVSRSLTSSLTEENEKKDYLLRNIGNIGFVESAMLISPIIIRNIFKKEKKGIYVVIWVLLFVFALMSSFTISLGLFLVFTFITMIIYVRKPVTKVVMGCCLVFVLFIDYAGLFSWIAEIIPNENMAKKIGRMAQAIVDNDMNALGTRYYYYKLSYDTFRSNWFGIGPVFFVYGSDIGNHSAILDDLARYGVLAVVFFWYVVKHYYEYVKFKWNNFGEKKLIVVCILYYATFLFLNPGFRYAYESIFVLLLFPNLPRIMKETDPAKEMRRT